MTEIDFPSLLFDSAWYLKTYPDIAAANADPVEHYLFFGFREGRNPNRFFNTTFYLNTYPDVAASTINPFIHYIMYGAAEGRLPRASDQPPIPSTTVSTELSTGTDIPYMVATEPNPQSKSEINLSFKISDSEPPQQLQDKKTASYDKLTLNAVSEIKTKLPNKKTTVKPKNSSVASSRKRSPKVKTQRVAHGNSISR